MRLLVTATPAGFGSATALDYEFEGPLGTAIVSLAAGVDVWVDPLEPSRFIRVQAQPLEPEANSVLESLLGASAAAEIGVAAGSAVYGTEYAPTEVEAELDDTVWQNLSSLGFLQWMEQYSTLPLGQSDFDIEIGVRASRLGTLGLWDVATERLQRSLVQLVQLARGVDAADGSMTAESAGIVRDALEIALDDQSLELDVVGEDEVRRLSARISATADALAHEDHALSRELSGLSLEGAPELAALVSPAKVAVHAGASADEAAVHVDSVNWNRVPRDILDSDDNTVESNWVDDEIPRLEVSVQPSSGAVLTGRFSRSLMFEVVSDVSQTEFVAAPLDYDETVNRYIGACYLERPLGQGERVEVYSVLSSLEPAFGVQHVELTAQRSAIRAYLAERLPYADGAIRRNARALWTDAGDTFGDAHEYLGSVKADADAYRQRVCAERAAVLAGPGSNDRPTLTLAEERYFAALPSN
jgi:hypothetical protein